MQRQFISLPCTFFSKYLNYRYRYFLLVYLSNIYEPYLRKSTRQTRKKLRKRRLLPNYHSPRIYHISLTVRVVFFAWQYSQNKQLKRCSVSLQRSFGEYVEDIRIRSLNNSCGFDRPEIAS